jgi:hypothetical protein
MGIFDRFKKKETVVKITETPKESKPKKEKVVGKSAKEIADEKGEPWVSVVKVDLDPENMGNGAFELDWNEKFITNLVRQGYQSKPGEAEGAIVDRWFQDVCRNVIQENYEQWEANQPLEARPRVIDKRDLGGGKTEVS